MLALNFVRFSYCVLLGVFFGVFEYWFLFFLTVRAVFFDHSGLCFLVSARAHGRHVVFGGRPRARRTRAGSRANGCFELTRKGLHGINARSFDFTVAGFNGGATSYDVNGWMDGGHTCEN